MCMCLWRCIHTIYTIFVCRHFDSIAYGLDNGIFCRQFGESKRKRCWTSKQIIIIVVVFLNGSVNIKLYSKFSHFRTTLALARWHPFPLFDVSFAPQFKFPSFEMMWTSLEIHITIACYTLTSQRARSQRIHFIICLISGNCQEYENWAKYINNTFTISN